MFESGLEKLIVGTAIVLWFASGWYLNEKLKAVHKKLDHLSKSFDGLRRYLYEIDPQFDDERDSKNEFEKSMNSDLPSFAGMNDMELTQKKEKEGKRTLNTTFHDQS